MNLIILMKKNTLTNTWKVSVLKLRARPLMIWEAGGENREKKIWKALLQEKKKFKRPSWKQELSSSESSPIIAQVGSKTLKRPSRRKRIFKKGFREEKKDSRPIFSPTPPPQIINGRALRNCFKHFSSLGGLLCFDFRLQTLFLWLMCLRNR